ncbi:hypothetical protein PtA15_5A539 [Puccinia triticina]|uniref:Uncharacterized protein n=1 Tax=Puccinia triticina TaxID=208348 RepID=A0ABY7CIA6_9BASI|nr:uncharacterized protein PtA15_5A539 [Puccinia triticina]WAQ84966.1 hypothetical protein PtA15_5A539 [Puccinia triticina]
MSGLEWQYWLRLAAIRNYQCCSLAGNSLRALAGMFSQDVASPFELGETQIEKLKVN